MKIELTAVEKRIAIARTWKDRVNGLVEKRRKKDPSYSEAQFCRDHKFDTGFLNKLKNFHAIPTQKTVNLIEKALKKEGV